MDTHLNTGGNAGYIQIQSTSWLRWQRRYMPWMKVQMRSYIWGNQNQKWSPLPESTSELRIYEQGSTRVSDNESTVNQTLPWFKAWMRSYIWGKCCQPKPKTKSLTWVYKWIENLWARIYMCVRQWVYSQSNLTVVLRISWLSRSLQVALESRSDAKWNHAMISFVQSLGLVSRAPEQKRLIDLPWAIHY